MDKALPLRLLAYENGSYFVFNPTSQDIKYHIVSYTWGPEAEDKYTCLIPGVSWDLSIASTRLREILGFMAKANIHYLWVDCLCINQSDDDEVATEVAKMFEYYKSAEQCHILLEMNEVWNPRQIGDDLNFIGHVLSYMVGTSLTSEAVGLTTNVINRLSAWADAREWRFGVEYDLDEVQIRSAGIDMGVLNCYATCIHHVMSLFNNNYFHRVWTFEEMILGKNIAMWAVKLESNQVEKQIADATNSEKPKPDTPSQKEGSAPMDMTILEVDQVNVSELGELPVWMDLTLLAKDKAAALSDWIKANRRVQTAAVGSILAIIEANDIILDGLRIQVRGLRSAKIDVISGGPFWWRDNLAGIANIFATFSLTPRKSKKMRDIFRGLLGLFHGLFTPEEVKRDLGGHDLEVISFNFFKQLSLKTGRGWTKLAVNTKEREGWNWIPLLEGGVGSNLSSDCFASVVDLGRLKPDKGVVKTQASLGVKGTPRKYMKIEITDQGSPSFYFTFKGCNCGNTVKVGTWKKRQLPVNDQPRNVRPDETGRVLVECATILGSLLDPSNNLVHYRETLLHRLRPQWSISDTNAKPANWEERCVHGTPWEYPEIWLRSHNMSMNYNLVAMEGCCSRLASGSAANLGCTVTVACGCIIKAPFSFIFEAITAIGGSSLGGATARIDTANRVMIRDGFGLVQAGDVGRSFSLVAFGGDVGAYASHSKSCRSTRETRPIERREDWPIGRALVNEMFAHGSMNMLREYGYIKTGGLGNLLILRNGLRGPYKIAGVCIEEDIFHTKEDDQIAIK
ncbi:hypothetical protein VHEMI06620 [[Torrubiella] hemipterigena]|uniref:Heterokaryon incompatibility domain-containing protein n=1 Tax=[Torrubiella] hemipterigena TaxID=1531966 RepID=A0A0A1TLF0_9HYPO|nr:hypothetical protein VHEMI06620 [[Torrubiella] hemipterigena]